MGSNPISRIKIFEVERSWRNGIRARFRIWWAQARVGSSPTDRMEFQMSEERRWWYRMACLAIVALGVVASIAALRGDMQMLSLIGEAPVGMACMAVVGWMFVRVMSRLFP